MQIDGVQVAIRYRGTRDIPGAAVTYLLSRLTQLVRLGLDPYQQSFTVQIDDRLCDVRLWVNRQAGHSIDIVDDTCTDFDGFLLWRKMVSMVNTFFASFIDGTSEQIKPIAEQTGNERLAGYEIPSIIQSSPTNIPPVSSSLYSGQMREVVQCYYLGQGFNPFGFATDRTHGILENPTRNPEVDPQVGDFFVIEISGRGVFAAPVKGGTRCCDSWDVSDYFAGEGEPPAYAKSLNLAWNALDRNPLKRPTVYTLVSSAVMTTVYALGEPFSPLSGWAFSASGREAQHVLQTETFNGFDFSTDSLNFYECSRVKFTFTVTNGIPAGAVQIVESKKKCTFHRPSNALWVPSGISNGTYDGIYIHLNEINGQDAPCHVFYVGEAESVLRYVKNTGVIPGIDEGAANNPNGDAVASIELAPVFRCPGFLLNLSQCQLSTRFIRSSYTLRQSGFKLTGPKAINAVGVATGSYSEFRSEGSAAGDLVINNSVISNFAALNPAIDPDCQRCGCPCAGIHQQSSIDTFIVVATTNSASSGISNGNASCAIIPQFEREGVVLIKSDTQHKDDETWSRQTNFYRTQHEFINISCIPSDPINGVCCQSDSYVASTCQFGGSAGPFSNGSSNTGLDSGTFVGNAVMRGKTFAQTLPTTSSGNADGPYAQATFWDKNFRTSVQLPLQVIGGGLYYEEEDDPLAIDRMTGFVFADAKGEFVYDGQPVTFVGRL